MYGLDTKRYPRWENRYFIRWDVLFLESLRASTRMATPPGPYKDSIVKEAKYKATKI